MRRKRLVSMICGVAATVPGASWAAQIGFRPGVATCADVNRIDGSPPLADLQRFEQVSAFQAAVVGSYPARLSGGPPPREFTVAVEGAATSGGNVGAPIGSPVAASFVVPLVATDQAAGGRRYGLDTEVGFIFTDNSRTTRDPSPRPFPTHAYVEVVISGKLEAPLLIGPGANVATSVGERTAVQTIDARMFFDVDGDPATMTDRTLIARFDTPPGPPQHLSRRAGTGPSQRLVLDVNWASAMPGVFADATGHELAFGAPDPLDPGLLQVSPAAASVAAAQIASSFECGLRCVHLSGTRLELMFQAPPAAALRVVPHTTFAFTRVAASTQPHVLAPCRFLDWPPPVSCNSPGTRNYFGKWFETACTCRKLGPSEIARCYEATFYCDRQRRGPVACGSELRQCLGACAKGASTTLRRDGPTKLDRRERK